jgi:hypothetical protein
MEKVIEEDHYYYRNEDGVRISDMIEALSEIEKEEGNLYVRTFNDGIPKGFEFIEVMSTWDGKKKCVVLSV